MAVFLHVILTFIRIGAFSFGGGYAVLALIQKEVVEVGQWIEAREFVNIMAVAGMTPGSIAISSSAYVGFKLYGSDIRILLTLCVVLIPFVSTLFVSYYFQKFRDSENLNLTLAGIRPAITDVVTAAYFSIGKISITGIHNLVFFLLALFAVVKLKTHPVLVLAGAEVLGVIYYLYLLPLF